MQLRIARPVLDLAKSREMYCNGLGLGHLGGFEDHQGFSGCMLGRQGLAWHLEFTQCLAHPIAPSPSIEDLLVFYCEEHEWERRCAAMLGAGFKRVESFNPYWEVQGASYEDMDGYRVVVQRGGWP